MDNNCDCYEGCSLLQAETTKAMKVFNDELTAVCDALKVLTELIELQDEQIKELNSRGRAQRVRG